ncbi:VOC family protein [Sphingobacterium daejeonense]|uniref:VOC family protein n=1 Tax=Sphingobacterium daejeonense TaxID=371142 RepID=UPI0010C2A46C|nr:VOC family protein [Sphingobacterium daejeonense]VTP97073.1 3-demethylubiquinone-9 3-methyltransferase [Sphingobacterium daejeonense]
MSNKIIPSLWFDNNAKEAFDFYTDVFPNSSITKDSPIVVEANIMGMDFIGINGGPIFSAKCDHIIHANIRKQGSIGSCMEQALRWRANTNAT